MRYIYIFLLISTMAACSPPKPPSYYGAVRVPINFQTVNKTTHLSVIPT